MGQRQQARFRPEDSRRSRIGYARQRWRIWRLREQRGGFEVRPRSAAPLNRDNDSDDELMVALSKIVPSRRRVLTIAVWVLAVAIFTWFFPLFHVVRLAEKQSQSKSIEFDARALAKQFWTQRLLPALGQATDVTDVLAAARSDPKQVRSRFGRTVGLSRSYFLFVYGSGTVTAIDKAGVKLAI